MTTQNYLRNPRTLVASLAGVVVLCSVFSVTAATADGRDVTVAIHVNARGLDLSQEAGLRKFYQRIKYAAWVACNQADRVSLAPVDDPQKCADQSLATAVRSTTSPALARIYLETHTLQQAAAMGISVPLAANPK
jgi:UrcA family protein